MNKLIELNFDGLLRQASMTTKDYLLSAERMIDARFGEGYAKKNPTLVGIVMQVEASDFNTSSTLKVVENSVLPLAIAIDRLASRLNK